MGLHIVNEANRCLKCKRPMCQQGCPIHTPIPQITQLFSEHKLMEAGRILFENNPLSVVCSTVCDHEAQCQGGCVLNRKGHPIHFSGIENYISDAYLDRMRIPDAPKKDKRVGVIGSGPAGLTVSIILAMHGYRVTIFEEKSLIGGMLRYGIPEFRLSKTVLDRYKHLLEKLDVQVRSNTVIGNALVIDNLFRDGYDTIFVGTGVWRPRTVGIKGESLGNVRFGINYLAHPSAHRLGQTVAIIGMGNVAMDVARTALRHGAQHVTMYERAQQATASAHEISYAQLDGAELVYRKSIDSINEKGPVFRDSLFDEEGNVIGVGDTLEQVYADSTIIAVSQAPNNKLVLLTTHDLDTDKRGLLLTDENCMTTRPGVFSAGDVVQGPHTVVHAVEEAKRAAAAMMRYMEA